MGGLHISEASRLDPSLAVALLGWLQEAPPPKRGVRGTIELVKKELVMRGSVELVMALQPEIERAGFSLFVAQLGAIGCSWCLTFIF